jgi:transcription antitermination factor NusG
MWHVLYAAPQCEPQVCKFLALHGVDGYAPQFPAPPRTRPGSVRARKHRWVFPGYVFVRPPEGFAQWDLIRWAPGVRRMLHADGGPAVLSEDIIDHLRQRLAAGSLRRDRPQFSPGQPVAILSGPLRMVDGIFERELDATSRVRILVQLLGRPLSVEVDAAILKPTG